MLPLKSQSLKLYTFVCTQQAEYRSFQYCSMDVNKNVINTMNDLSQNKIFVSIDANLSATVVNMLNELLVIFQMKSLMSEWKKKIKMCKLHN